MTDAKTDAPTFTISELRQGEENDGPLESVDLYLSGRGISLLINIPLGSTVYYSLAVDGVQRAGTIEAAELGPQSAGERAMAKATIDPRIVKDLLTVVHALMPGIGSLALQDYRIINEAPIRAEEWLRTTKNARAR